MQQAGIKAQLFQLAGARTGVQLRAMGLLGGVNFRLGGPNPAGGGFHRGVGSGAPSFRRLLRLLADGQYSLEPESKGFHTGLAGGMVFGLVNGSSFVARSDHDCSSARLSLTP